MRWDHNGPDVQPSLVWFVLTPSEDGSRVQSAWYRPGPWSTKIIHCGQAELLTEGAIMLSPFSGMTYSDAQLRSQLSTASHLVGSPIASYPTRFTLSKDIISWCQEEILSRKATVWCQEEVLTRKATVTSHSEDLMLLCQPVLSVLDA